MRVFAKSLCANKCEGFRGLRLYAVAFPAFDKGLSSAFTFSGNIFEFVLNTAQSAFFRPLRAKFHKKYPLNITFLTQSTVFSSLAQWPRTSPSKLAVRVQASADPVFFSIFHLWGGGHYCLLFYHFFCFTIFCLLVCFSFIPIATFYLIFTRFSDTRISRYY